MVNELLEQKELRLLTLKTCKVLLPPISPNSKVPLKPLPSLFTTSFCTSTRSPALAEIAAIVLMQHEDGGDVYTLRREMMTRDRGNSISCLRSSILLGR